MSQEFAWEKEYRNPKFLTRDTKPQADTVRFVKFLKKSEVRVEEKFVLDLGSGTGRNSQYFAEIGASVAGVEISATAVKIAKEYAKEQGQVSKRHFDITYHKQSMGKKFPVDTDSQDIILDVTSSNSLTENERGVYLNEINRVLKTGGYIFLKALCKDGDENAKHLIRQFPGTEKDTYILPDVGVVERVWTKEDLVATYSPHFKILELEKKTTYTQMNNRSYKRNFWICYMQKK